jgi:pyruvate dehydrogenase E2 component (dihydrolipoamide acetyltransferase)
MNYEIKMPSLGADMDKGKLLNWRIHIDDHIEKGQIIADIETQKAAVEIESFKNGIIKKIIAKEGDVIPVGQTIAEMEIEEQKPKKESLTNLTSIKLDSATPSTSNLNIREAIAKAMSKSKKEIPHYYLKTSIEINDLLAWLDRENEKRSLADRILISAIFVKALAIALKKHPEMNGLYTNNQFYASQETNINLAISLKDGGVIVPALLNTESKNLDQINKDLKDLIERTRDHKLKQKELTDGTITLTILGELGVEEVYGVIFPPQVALLGIGSIHKEVVAKDNQPKIVNVIKVSLAADHRVSDGIIGSKFLKAFGKALTEIDQGLFN